MSKATESPYKLVAKVLKISPDALNENSTMGETPNWDSLCHVILIGVLENTYGIQIPNEEIEKYTTMQAILALHERLKKV